MDSADMKHPLTLWEKIKSGTMGFVKATLDYLPKGLLIAGVLMGGSALLGMASPGLDFFHTQQLFNDGAGAIAASFGKMLLIGGLISGSIGAYQHVSAETRQRDAEIDAQGELLERARALGPERQIETHAVMPAGLPLAASRDTQIQRIH